MAKQYSTHKPKLLLKNDKDIFGAKFAVTLTL